MPRLSAKAVAAASAVNRLLVVDYTQMVAAVAATGTITIVNYTETGATITVGGVAFQEGVAFTAVTSNDATASALAAALTAAIATTLNGVITSAVAVGAVVTVTAPAGSNGNGVTLASNNASFATVSGETLSGGDDATQNITFPDKEFIVGEDFTSATSNNATATSIAAAIQGDLPSGIQSASADGALITITATPGAAGNAITILLDEAPGGDSGGLQLVPGRSEFQGGVTAASLTRGAATGRGAASNRLNVFNFPNSLLFASASNQYGSVSTPADVQVSSRTIEFWAMFRTLPASTMPIFSLGLSNYYFGFTTGSMIASYADSGAVQRTAFSSALGLRRHVWAHYAITVETSGNDVTRTFYRNGMQVGTTTNSTGHSSTYGSTLYLATFAPASLNFDGYLANVGFYNRALSATEVVARARNIPVTSGLIHRWLMSEGSGATVADSVGSANFALTNTPTWLSTVVPMKARTAV